MCLEEMLPHPKALPCFESNGWLSMFRLGIPSTASCWESGVSTGGCQPVILFFVLPLQEQLRNLYLLILGGKSGVSACVLCSHSQLSLCLPAVALG